MGMAWEYTAEFHSWLWAVRAQLLPKVVLGSHALKNPPVLGMKKETSFAIFPTGSLRNCGSVFLSLFKTDDATLSNCIGSLSSGSLVIQGWGRENLYIWKIHKIHKLQSALWREHISRDFPWICFGICKCCLGELVLCLLVSGVKGTTVSYLFPFAVGLGRWILLQDK